ncbi:hypothetical protein R5R35_013789 [Gryllus longicercus]|uniref:G-protein coupled receptors family 1 profile domain-containing protein n=1 Tax=Gryllus longicercus TaxID=2509291 RepID=A0AAN9VY55_9ORTH
MENETCPPLETLYFLHYDETNITEVNELKKQWPCEIRIYWHSANIQNLASIVWFLFNYAIIALIIIGLVINICSLIILNSPPINKSNMSVYLKALAIADMGALIFSIGVGVLRAKSILINDIFITHKWMCTLHKMLLSLFVYYSTWLVVIFSFERFLMIKNPFKIHSWHNEKPAKITVIILAIAALILAILRSLTTGFEKDNMFGFKPCGARDHAHISINMVPIILVNLILPTILIIIANVCTALHLQRSTHLNNSLRANKEKNYYHKITRMVFIISFVYVIFYLPFGIAACTELYFRNNEPPSTEHALYIKWLKKLMLMHWIRGFCLFLHLLNFVNNFFLYCLSGDIFRQAVKACFPSQRWKCSCSAESCFSGGIFENWFATFQETKEKNHLQMS